METEQSLKLECNWQYDENCLVYKELQSGEAWRISKGIPFLKVDVYQIF